MNGYECRDERRLMFKHGLKDKHSKFIVHGTRAKTKTNWKTHTHTRKQAPSWCVFSHYSPLCQRSSHPAGHSPDPQHWSQTARTVLQISQGALQAHSTPLMLWSRRQVWCSWAYFWHHVNGEKHLWWTEPEEFQSLVWSWLCKVDNWTTSAGAY